MNQGRSPNVSSGAIIKNDFFSHSTIECADKLPDSIANIADGSNEDKPSGAAGVTGAAATNSCFDKSV